MSFKEKIEAGVFKKKLPKDFSKINFSEKSKKTLITPLLFKDVKDKKKISEIVSKNIFTEDQYFDISFCEVKIVRTVFSFCRLKDCDFSRATLIRCDFSFANLENCNFSNATMIECNFRHAQIKNSNFGGVDEFLCDFQGVVI